MHTEEIVRAKYWPRDGTRKLVSRFDKSDNRTSSAEARIVGDGDPQMRPAEFGGERGVVQSGDEARGETIAGKDVCAE
jgi:hypothetical protein